MTVHGVSATRILLEGKTFIRTAGCDRGIVLVQAYESCGALVMGELVVAQPPCSALFVKLVVDGLVVTFGERRFIRLSDWLSVAKKLDAARHEFMNLEETNEQPP